MKRDNSGIDGRFDNHPLSAAYKGNQDTNNDQDTDNSGLNIIGLLFVACLLIGGLAFFFYVILPAVASFLGL